MLDRQRQQEEVERAVDQLGDQLLGVRLAQVQVELRVLVAQQRQQRGQHVGGDGRDDAELDGGGERLARLAGEVRDVAHLLQDAVAAAGDLASRVCQARAFRAPLHELDAEVPLHLLDLHGEGRLRHGAVRGRLAEVAEAGNRVQIAQLFDRDHCDQFFLSGSQYIQIRLDLKDPLASLEGRRH